MDWGRGRNLKLFKHSQRLYAAGKTLLPTRLKTGPKFSSYENTGLSFFFKKSLRPVFLGTKFLLLGESGFQPSSHQIDTRTRLKIEMKTESPVRTTQPWTKPQSEEEYTADQFT